MADHKPSNGGNLLAKPRQTLRRLRKTLKHKMKRNRSTERVSAEMVKIQGILNARLSGGSSKGKEEVKKPEGKKAAKG
jgi:hypothetical protein